MAAGPIDMGDVGLMESDDLEHGPTQDGGRWGGGLRRAVMEIGIFAPGFMIAREREEEGGKKQEKTKTHIRA